MGKVKATVLEIVKELPDDCTWEDVLHRGYVRRQIEAGLKDEAEGQLVSHEEVFAKYP